jgi:hypothetical protein
MINIDLINGELKYEKWIFSSKKKLTYFMSLFLPSEIELWSFNQNWMSYRLNLSECFIFILYFQDEILKIIDILPVDTNSGNEVPLLLEKLGGENIYSWGKIELNNDIKAGYKSVLIKYE